MADIPRRLVLLGAAALTAAGARPTAWDYTFTAIEGGELPLARFRGRVLLVTNTASFCGFTYQYEALEKLDADLEPRGLTVVGIPSQDFHQEKATNAEVKDFCDATFGVTFPMAGLTHVAGPQAHPFYKWVKAERNWEPSWNFNKVLIGRDGAILALFGSTDEPRGPAITAALGKALAAQA